MAVTSESANVPSSGWSTRLYWLWILYNSVAFVVVLTAVAVLAWIGADVLRLSWDDRGRVAALLVATLGAVLFGGVLGALQWQSSASAHRFPGSGGSWRMSDRRSWGG